jgi:hypothetical protein
VAQRATGETLTILGKRGERGAAVSERVTPQTGHLVQRHFRPQPAARGTLRKTPVSLLRRALARQLQAIDVRLLCFVLARAGPLGGL